MIQATNRENNQQMIRLLGQFSVQQNDRTITRFRTRKAAELLAYLAYYRHRQHAREALLEMLWPDEEIEAARNRLSVELNSLRRQLEPPGVPAGAILRTDRTHVQLNPEAYTTDVVEFEEAIQAAGQEEDNTRQAALLTQAIDLYRGELLPGYYGDWALAERERLADAYFSALRQLTGCLVRVREFEQALAYARRAIQADSLREASYRDLMRLYSVLGRPAAAMELYGDLEHILQEALGAKPSMATQELVAQISAQAGAAGETGLTAPSRLPSPPASSSGASLASSPMPRESAEATFPVCAGSLPMQFTRFFGREAEMASLEALLSDAGIRLITLSGPGGSGKTRLSIEVGRRLREGFPGGVWFVPLADLSDARVILETIRDSLSLPRSPNLDPLEQIVEALSAQPSLLILDNFEQVAAGGAPMVRTLLTRVESLSCLVTSRQTLRLAGEREFPVPPLPVPQGGNSPEQLLHTASAQLFVDRAQAVRPDFQVTANNAGDVAGLCADLEGIPLSIELAAARAKALTPAQIRERLSERFALLATRRLDKGSRHRSLWAAIDWSYHLLPPALQQFFAGLSVFRGGWTLEAAEVVCEEPLALDYLAQLQGHSLVSAEESAPQLHFRMLESLREYAQEQLDEKERQELARRHRDYFLYLAEEAKRALLGPEQIRWLDRLEREHDNLRAALEGCLTDSGGAQQGLRLAAALWPFWETRGFAAEGYNWLSQLLALESDRTHAYAQALNGAGNLAHIQGDYASARRLFEESLVLYRELDDPLGIAVLLGNLAIVVGKQGDRAASYALAQESLALRRKMGDKPGIALALNNLGSMARKQGDYQTARALLEESLALRQEMGDLSGVALAYSNLGNLAYHQADYPAARAYQEQSLQLRREIGDKGGIA
ncbi:MAG TPA: tetratricopeptide repeat protein, partial [Chthonomonadaceae bacterium]|nr:tetratricopeptide repeat protein [Chthonomonadaceae bacterium]